MADPGYYGNVIWECNFNGSDGDTTFTSSISIHYGGGQYIQPAFFNQAHIEDDVTLFGNAVVEFDGVDDWLYYAAAGYTAWIADHTIAWALEVWAYFDTITGDHTVFSNTYGDATDYPGIELGTDSSGNMTGGIKDYGGFLEVFDADDVFEVETWYYIKVSFDPNNRTRVYVNGVREVDVATGTKTGAADTQHLAFGRDRMTATRYMDGRIGPVRLTKNESVDDSDVPTAIFAFPGWPTFEGDILLPNPLEAGTTQMVGEQDFSAATVGLPANYLMELSGTTAYRIPISSWQATTQSDRANYLQCVIPNAGDYVAEITARQDTETFNIYSLVEIDGNDMRALISSSLIDYLTLDQGPTNYTCTLSGYPAAYVPGTPKTRTLSNVRTKSTDTNGNMRVRCDIDWYLRPGDTAYAGADEMTVTYINYYVNNTQAYMDVGER